LQRSDSMKATLPGLMNRAMQLQRSNMWCRYSRSSFTMV
jgi:hypothetical protein